MPPTHRPSIHHRAIALALALTLALLMNTPPARAAALTLYVSPTGVDGVNNCQSPAAPCVTIAYALTQIPNNSTSDGSVINLAAGVYSEFFLGIANIDYDFSVVGAGQATTVITGGGVDDPLWQITSTTGISASFSQLTLENAGTGISFDAPLGSTAALQLTHVTLQYHTEGALSVTGDVDVTLTNTTFYLNQSETSGAAIQHIATSGNPSLTIIDSTITNNTIVPATPSASAAIFYDTQLTTTSTLLIQNSDLSDNQSQHSGGALYANSATVTITDSTLNNNTTLSDNALGGAVYVTNGTLAMTDSTLDGNQALGKSSQGGAIAVEATGVNLQRTIIRNSQADFQGGGIFVQNATAPGKAFTLTDVAILNNTVVAASSGVGGGVYLGLNFLSITLNRVTLRDNQVSNGVGSAIAFYTAGGTVADLINVTIDNNRLLNTPGGAVYVLAGTTATFTHATISDNRVFGTDAAAIANFGTVTIASSLITGTVGGVNCGGTGVYTASGVFSNDASCPSGSGFTPNANVQLAPVNSSLGLLPVRPIVTGSAGDNAITTTCGIGVDTLQTPRVNPCDAGAFEGGVVVYKVFLPLLRKAP